MVAQAFALGATSVVSRPKEIVTKLAEIEVAQKAAQAAVQANSAKSCPTRPRPRSRIVRPSSASMFTAIRDGRPFKLSDAENATTEIINGIEQNGLSSWLNDVRRYHEGTFQHCLLVTGVAVGFATGHQVLQLQTSSGSAWRQPCTISARRISPCPFSTSPDASIRTKKRS